MTAHRLGAEGSACALPRLSPGKRRWTKRRAELELDHGDDLLGSARKLSRDLSGALEEARPSQSLGHYLQVFDRMQKQLALQARLLERAQVVGSQRFELAWLDCPHHPTEECPLLATNLCGESGAAPTIATTSDR
jgi:hypothetical protein